MRIHKSLYLWITKGSFYNRMMIMNALILVIVLMSFAFFTSTYVKVIEKERQLSNNQQALEGLSRYYNKKGDSFLEILMSIYDDETNFNIISELLELDDDNLYESDAYTKQLLFTKMKQLVTRDEDITMILLYKQITDSAYVYDKQMSTFSKVSLSYPFFDKLSHKSTGRVVYSSQVIESGQGERIVYGIAGSMGTRNIKRDAGQIMIAFDTEHLNKFLKELNYNIKGSFVIVTPDGQVIFDSTGKYYEKPYPYMNQIRSGSETNVFDGEECFISTIKPSNQNYIAVCITPQSVINESLIKTQLLIYIGCTALILLILLIYGITTSIISKHVNDLTRAMSFVGSNNLEYRIPIKGTEDEFEQIAVKFNRMCDDLQYNIERVYIYEIKQKSAELGALQAKINPHFLYNTLEAIRGVVYEDGNEEASEMIVSLASMFRNMIKSNTYITIEDEIEFCRMYLNIFSFRYDDNIEVKFNVENNILNYGIVKNLLQPIIENYFIHGFQREREDNYLEINGYREGDDIILKVIDNGKGIEQKRLTDICSRLEIVDVGDNLSYGLANVNERIKIVFGKHYGLTIESIPGIKTCIKVCIKVMDVDMIKEKMKNF